MTSKKVKKLAPMSPEATVARLGALLRPPGSVEVVDPDVPLLDTLRGLGWAIEVDWKDDAASVLGVLEELSAPWGGAAIRPPPDTVEFEPLLRHAGVELARAGLALLRVENFVLAVCALEHGPEAAARLDALGAAEDGACLFPREHAVDSAGLLREARPKRGAAAQRQRLGELVSADDPPPRCTTLAALTKLLARCTVATRNASGRPLAAWELMGALRKQLQERRLSEEAVRDIAGRAAPRFHGSADLSFVAFLDGVLAQAQLSLIILPDDRLVVCRRSEREEAESLLMSLGLATATPLVVEELPALQVLEVLDLGLRPVDWSGDPSGQFGQANAISPTVFVETDSWPPTGRPLGLPGDVRASMLAYQDGVQVAQGLNECFHRAGPSRSWESFGRPVGRERIRWGEGRFSTRNDQHPYLEWNGAAWEPAPRPQGRYRRVLASSLGGDTPVDGPPGFQLVPLDYWAMLAASACFYVLHRESGTYSIVFLETFSPDLRRHPHEGAVKLAYSAEADEVRCVVPVWTADGGRLWAMRFAWSSVAGLPRHPLPQES